MTSLIPSQFVTDLICFFSLSQICVFFLNCISFQLLGMIFHSQVEKYFEKCLEMREMQFLLFIGTFEKFVEMGETQFLLFIGTFGGNGKIITFVTDRRTDSSYYI